MKRLKIKIKDYINDDTLKLCNEIKIKIKEIRILKHFKRFFKKKKL